MESIDAVDRLYLCGTSATFTLEKGASISGSEIAKALKARGMKLESFTKEERARPAVAWAMPISGSI